MIYLKRYFWVPNYLFHHRYIKVQQDSTPRSKVKAHHFGNILNQAQVIQKIKNIKPLHYVILCDLVSRKHNKLKYPKYSRTALLEMPYHL
jgi:hypothetical protein